MEFINMTLSDAKELKNSIINDSEKESKDGSKKPESMDDKSIFKSNINRNPGGASKPPDHKPRKS